MQGVVFRVKGDGWSALDEKEGAPHVYRRLETECVTIAGAGQAVTTYEVTPSRRLEYVEPSDAYVDVVRRGYSRFKLDEDLLDRAVNNDEARAVDGLFVYGSLMRGECRHEVLRRSAPKCILLAEVPGRLLNFGPYPGLELRPESQTSVQGEFVRLRDPAVLRVIDEVEGFVGYGRGDSLYRRALVDVGMRDGRVRRAWTYLPTAACGEARSDIESGDWRGHRGVKASFLKSLVSEHCGTDEYAVARHIVNRGPMPPADEDVAIRRLLPLDVALASGRISERRLAQYSGRWNVEPASAACGTNIALNSKRRA